MTWKLSGLIAATHTPFAADGSLNLEVIEPLANHLSRSGVKGVFVGGSTGESTSLMLDERLELVQRWADVTKNSSLDLIVHVGSNSIADARLMAAHAQTVGAKAISAVSPNYFKPASVPLLVACCQQIASAAPGLPFYFYDIPPLTGVSLPMVPFLEQAATSIPTLSGLKFSNPDLMMFQRCLHHAGGRFEVSWGIDEYLLAALALGGSSAVGSSYNFAAPIYQKLMTAFSAGDLGQAQKYQFQSVQLIHLLASYGYFAAAKATMGFLGIPVGQPRLPHKSLSNEEQATLRGDLEKLGLFDWIASTA